MISHWKIRNAKTNDIEFIYATWLNSFHYDSWTKQTKKSVFFSNYKRVIDHILLSASVDVACLPDNEDTILGYMVYDKPEKIIHYAFVKDGFRKFGIFTDLYTTSFSKDEPIEITHKTRTVSQIVRENSNLIFNPFKLYERE